MKGNSQKRQRGTGTKSKKHSKKKSRQERSDIKPWLLIDCSALCYASFHTIGHLSYQGDHTGVIFGFLHQILGYAEKWNTSKIITCWDAGRTWRHRDYPQYKAKRRQNLTPEQKEERDSLTQQMMRLNREILPKLGFQNNFFQLEYEADDLLAYWANRLHERGRKAIMITTDADMFQCLDKCDIFMPQKKEMITQKKFEEKYGVKPSQWAMAKAIGGCSTDNVIGIEGISDPKSPTSKALKYLRGELVKGAIYDRIKAGEETINKNLPIVTCPYRPESMKTMIIRRNKFSRKRFLKMFDKLGFTSFLKKDGFARWKEIFLQEGT